MPPRHQLNNSNMSQAKTAVEQGRLVTAVVFGAANMHTVLLQGQLAAILCQPPATPPHHQ
jgi:hypothetical protein